MIYIWLRRASRKVCNVMTVVMLDGRYCLVFTCPISRDLLSFFPPETRRNRRCLYISSRAISQDLLLDSGDVFGRFARVVGKFSVEVNY